MRTELGAEVEVVGSDVVASDLAVAGERLFWVSRGQPRWSFNARRASVEAASVEGTERRPLAWGRDLPTSLVPFADVLYFIEYGFRSRAAPVPAAFCAARCPPAAT